MSELLNFDIFGGSNPFPTQQGVNPTQHTVSVIFASSGLEAVVSLKPNATVEEAVYQAQQQLALAKTSNVSVATDVNPVQQLLSEGGGKSPLVDGSNVVTTIRVTAGKLGSNV